MTATNQTATVTQLHVQPLLGYLPYRWADGFRVGVGPVGSWQPIHRNMLLIEDQLALAYQAADGDAVEAHALLSAAGCVLTFDQVEELYVRSVRASELELVQDGSGAWVARQEYDDLLVHLARVVADARPQRVTR